MMFVQHEQEINLCCPKPVRIEAVCYYSIFQILTYIKRSLVFLYVTPISSFKNVLHNTFFVQLFSFSIRILISIHVVACINSSFLFTDEQCSMVQMYYYFLSIYQLMDFLLLPVLAITNKTARNIKKKRMFCTKLGLRFTTHFLNYGMNFRIFFKRKKRQSKGQQNQIFSMQRF